MCLYGSLTCQHHHVNATFTCLPINLDTMSDITLGPPNTIPLVQCSPNFEPASQTAAIIWLTLGQGIVFSGNVSLSYCKLLYTNNIPKQVELQYNHTFYNSKSRIIVKGLPVFRIIQIVHRLFLRKYMNYFLQISVSKKNIPTFTKAWKAYF